VQLFTPYYGVLPQGAAEYAFGVLLRGMSMEEKERAAYRKNFMARFVALMPELPESVLKDYKAWVEGLSDDAFEDYLNKLNILNSVVPTRKPGVPKEKGIFVCVESYPMSEAPYRERLQARQRAASIYYALGLWKALEAKKIESEGPPNP
jgi:hypothetical protein